MGRRAISEYMAQVTLAMAGRPTQSRRMPYLRSSFVLDDALINDVEETGPSTTALELRGTVEQWLSAPSAYIDAIFVMVPKFARERSLGAALPQDAIFFRCQRIAPVDCIRGC